MSSTLNISFLNPLQIVDVNPPGDPALYATKHIDDYYFSDQIYRFQNKIQFLQAWVAGDIIRLQFESDYAPIVADMQDQYGRIITGKSLSMTAVRQNKYIPGLIVYEATMSLSGLPNNGPFRYLFTPAGDLSKQQKTEWFTIKPTPEGTIRIDYFNTEYMEDVVFETGIVFSLRIPGYIEYDSPGSKIVVFEDQILNQTVVSGRPFRQVILHVGDGSGVPPWLIDKVNRSMMCNNWILDDKQFAITDGKWSPDKDDDMQLKGFSTNIREGNNRSSKVILGSGDPNKKITLIFGINGQLFGDVSANAGEDVIRVLGQG